MEETNIYVIKLESSKWYVGKSSNVRQRFQDHIDGSGSVWTRMFRPIEIVEIQKGNSFDEDKIVKMYMLNYGVENVRGGSWSYPNLNPNEIKMLERELRGATDRCFRCGYKDHFASECYAVYDTNGNRIVCQRCGRGNHDQVNCYAKTHANGKLLAVTPPAIPEKMETPLTIPTPKPLVHLSHPDVTLEIEPDNQPPGQPCYSCKGRHHISQCPTPGQICYNCGRSDHWKVTCTATQDINGKPLEFNLIGSVGSLIKSWW